MRNLVFKKNVIILTVIMYPACYSHQQSAAYSISVWKLIFFIIYTLPRPRVLLHYLYSIKVRYAAPQTTLWGGPGPRFEPGTGDLETLRLKKRQLFSNPFLKKDCQFIIQSLITIHCIQQCTRTSI